MKKRPLGSTGLLVSEIGMGCEGFVGKSPEEIGAFLDVMEAEGLNCIDLYSSNPELRFGLGKALRGRREKFVIQGHLCSVWQDGQYKRTRDPAEVRAGFEDLLERLESPSVEIGMIHYVDSLADWEEVARGPVMAYAQAEKAAGRIGAIGLSSHNPEAALAAVESGLIQVLMFSVNPCYDLQPAGEDCEDLWKPESYQGALVNMDPAREALYEACSRRGVGITVMKAFGGGDLLNEAYSPAGRALTPWQCIRYALDRPGVASVLAGARTVEELRDCAAYGSASPTETDYAAALASVPRISWEGHCMYCGHCAPCPVGIDVAAVTKFLSLCRAQGEVPETVREHYALLPHGAGECVGCGACRSRCPFGVDAPANMAEAAALFGR